jgi:hypothetical protein
VKALQYTTPYSPDSRQKAILDKRVSRKAVRLSSLPSAAFAVRMPYEVP